jgi:hypothetical protein
LSEAQIKNNDSDTDHKKEIISLLKQAAYSKSVSQVFNDFLEMAAISVANSVDFTHRDEREKRYLSIINSYEKRHQELFPEMLAKLVLALDEKAQTVGTEDILGVIFHELELHDVYKGQFFTPHHVSDFMAEITCGDESQTAIQEQGYITACEPCCGSGVMVLSFCKSMKKNNLSYQNQLVVTAVDIDIKCVHMTFLQLALYGVPAVVIHGNSLTCEEFSRWYTPIYLLNGWIWRQRCGIASKFCVEGTEIQYTGYARLPITFDPPTVEGSRVSIRNNEQITFAKADINAGTVRHIGIFDSPTGGNMFLYGNLTEDLPILQNESPVLLIDEVLFFSIGDLSTAYKTRLFNVVRGITLNGFIPHLSLFNGDPQSGGAELSGDNYSRVPVTFSAPVNESGSIAITRNTTRDEFNRPTSNWGNWTFTVIYDSISAGEPVFSQQRTIPKNITRGIMPYADPNDITAGIG